MCVAGSGLAHPLGVDTVVQPDLLVVCDPAKLDERGVVGAPDLVIEILSESTTHRDLDLKLRLYEKHGVRCYIIVDPWGKTLTVVVAVYGIVLVGVYVYQSWMSGV